jgi:hypothetical protein
LRDPCEHVAECLQGGARDAKAVLVRAISGARRRRHEFRGMARKLRHEPQRRHARKAHADIRDCEFLDEMRAQSAAPQALRALGSALT